MPPTLLLLSLFASLGLSATASASPVPANGLLDLLSPPVSQVAPDDDGEADEFEDEEFEDEEEGEADEWEEWEAGKEPPLECLLRSASARAVIPAHEDKLRLTISYTAYEETVGLIDYTLRGTKGTLHPPRVRQRLGEHGVLRITDPLGPTEAERARATNDITVRFRIAEAPGECKPVLTRHLTIKRSVHKQLVFRQSDSIFGGQL